MLVTEKNLPKEHEGPPKTQIQAIFNNIDMSNYFLKVRMISDEMISTQVNAASMRCVITLLNDKKIIVSGGSTGQGAFHGL